VRNEKVKIRDIPWFGILMTLVVLAALALGVWAIYASIADYRNQCHDSGGHIITTNSNDVCVDHDNKVIFV
jgi:hypothetical protein